MADSDDIGRDEMRVTPFAWALRGCGCLAILGVVAAILLPALAPARSGHRGSCANNLKQIGLSLKMYSNEDRSDLMPSPSLAPGSLTFEMRQMYPEYLPDPNILICVLDPRVKAYPELNDGYPGVVETYFEASNYFYLGYALLDDDDVERFAQAYREHAKTGEPMDEDIVSVADPEGLKTLYRFREGVEQELVKRRGLSLDEPGVSARVQSDTPLVIERVGTHKPAGANVLYLDGHVKFVKYPGPWPMTEKTVRILNELDALGGAKK